MCVLLEKNPYKTYHLLAAETRQQKAIKMAFRWRADDGPLKVVFGSSLPSSTKKTLKTSELDSLWQNFLDPNMPRDSLVFL